MISKPTVLVLGAGASKPYGLPLGGELRDEVLRSARTAALEFQLQQIGFGFGELDEFADELARSGFGSVDAFLEQRPQWTSVGKASMASCLLSAEGRSKTHLLPPGQPKDHWYQALWTQLKSPSWSAFKRQPISIVTFNYDRTLEHYLVEILCYNYGIKWATALAGLPIVHVHGSLGEYDPALFGVKPDSDMYFNAADSIRVVHEADVAQSGFLGARASIVSAERVVFLGFGYLDANMRKLGMGQRTRSAFESPAIVGTHKGYKTRAWARICDAYGFHPSANTHGGGTISELVYDWVS